jgi:iron(III) transport system substrate-binding protein
MPHPASSGTGYLMVAAWLQMMGEDKGWAYMDALHQNIGVYTHSGSKPCRQAGAGEFPVGLSFEYRANKTKKDGAPIDIVFPREGLGWDVEATAIMKTSKKQEAAKALADWAVTPDANKLYAANFAVLALPEAQEKHEFIPADLEKRLAKNDFNWAAANRDRILSEWARRYEAKAERSNTPEALSRPSGAARRRTTPARRGGPCAVSLGRARRYARCGRPFLHVERDTCCALTISPSSTRTAGAARH